MLNCKGMLLICSKKETESTPERGRTKSSSMTNRCGSCVILFEDRCEWPKIDLSFGRDVVDAEQEWIWALREFKP